VKIGLGTVQFGTDYGISNQDGKTSLDEIEKILDVAMHNGISIVDTAAIYGTSEEALGKTLLENHRFGIVTKTPRFTSVAITSDDMQRLEDSFFQSLQKMKQEAGFNLWFINPQCR